MRKSCFVMVSKGKGDLDLDLDIYYSLCFFFKRCTNFLYKQEAGPTMKVLEVQQVSSHDQLWQSFRRHSLSCVVSYAPTHKNTTAACQLPFEFFLHLPKFFGCVDRPRGQCWVSAQSHFAPIRPSLVGISTVLCSANVTWF